jgi:hypothetical protein
MIEGVRQGTTGRRPYRNASTAGSWSRPPRSAGSAGGEHDACSFQLGLNPYPFDVALRADRVIRKLVWDVQHLAGLH